MVTINGTFIHYQERWSSGPKLIYMRFGEVEFQVRVLALSNIVKRDSWDWVLAKTNFLGYTGLWRCYVTGLVFLLIVHFVLYAWDSKVRTLRSRDSWIITSTSVLHPKKKVGFFISYCFFPFYSFSVCKCRLQPKEKGKYITSSNLL